VSTYVDIAPINCREFLTKLNEQHLNRNGTQIVQIPRLHGFTISQDEFEQHYIGVNWVSISNGLVVLVYPGRSEIRTKAERNRGIRRKSE
jgi:hypothetical protein